MDQARHHGRICVELVRPVPEDPGHRRTDVLHSDLWSEPVPVDDVVGVLGEQPELLLVLAQLARALGQQRRRFLERAAQPPDLVAAVREGRERLASGQANGVLLQAPHARGHTPREPDRRGHAAQEAEQDARRDGHEGEVLGVFLP